VTKARLAALMLSGLSLVLIATACGSSSTGSAPPSSVATKSPGAQVFATAGCGGCHTLAAAQSNGAIGPNLDQLKPNAATIVRQVTHGGAGMPSFSRTLSHAQITAVAAFVSQSTQYSIATVPEFHPNHETLADCHGNYLCYKQAFGNISFYDGPQKALSELAQQMRKNQLVNAGCHLIAHEIGHAAYLRYHNNASVALAHGAMTCWSGYYHGVIERAFGGVPRGQVAATARRLCTGPAVNTSSFLLYQCVHGLGHGLMIYSGDDLPYSLRICDHLQTRWDQTSCTGGVFMQNFLPGPMQLVQTTWVRAKDLLYPCDVVATRDKLYCYLMVTSRILPAVSYSWAKAASWCRRSEPGWVATCFQSLGRDASGNTRQNARQILTICRTARSMERECIYGAARDITSNDANATRSTPFCANAPQLTRSYCFYGIGTILGGLTNNPAARRAKCNIAPVGYRPNCYQGANA
jgi:mono/diheme cytochrome c family protein